MKYPTINKQPRREINIPQLSGGLNLRDSLTGIRDNQMTECVNMWYKEGVLRTRPNFDCSGKIHTIKNGKKEEKSESKIHSEIKVFYNDCQCVLASNKCVYYNADENKRLCNIDFMFLSKENIYPLPQIKDILSDSKIEYFCTEMSGVIYCYVSDFSIWKLEYRNEDKTEWEEIRAEERYVPTAYIHCQRSGWDDFKGTFFEGYNLISNSYKMIYSAYNEADSDKSHPMRYGLGQKLPKSGIIKAKITTYDAKTEDMKTIEHTIEYEEDDYNKFSKGEIFIERFGEGVTSEDGLRLFVKYNYIGFVFASQSDGDEDKEFIVATLTTEANIRKYGCNEDNVVITAPYEVSEKDLKKVFNMTQNIWYGGVANGINGGSRLLLCGNTNEDEKSLIVWSGLNEPLYFGENCYAYVGDKSSSVTAFGKQGENLIVFKENKIFTSYYQQNTNINADDLINQTIVDFGANSASFPLIQINGFIGCDCPQTIQMCRNRLVWATTAGKVYTLCTMSQYNEHTVYELSDMIAPKLKKYKDRIKNAIGVDFNGHYLLFLQDCAFVMDYSSYGYQYVYSYSKNEDANILIPWYFWDFSFLRYDNDNKSNNTPICIIGDSMILLMYSCYISDEQSLYCQLVMNEDGQNGFDRVFDINSDNTDLLKDSIINCNLTTKMFEFGGGFYSTNVDSVAVKFTTDASDIKVKFVTEYGEEVLFLDNKRENTFTRGKVFYPNVKSVAKFGLNFECDGHLCIDGVSVIYRLLGGVK